MNRILFTKQEELWTYRDQSDCPRLLRFDLEFPTTCEFKQGEYPLPPSYDVKFSGVPGLCAEISYALKVRVVRPRCGVWKRCKTSVYSLLSSTGNFETDGSTSRITIPLKYKPRSRPYLPISPGLYPFLSTINSAPEEWHQETSVMPSRHPDFDPIDCHVRCHPLIPISPMLTSLQCSCLSPRSRSMPFRT